MEELFNLIYVSGDLLATCVRLFVVGLCLDTVLMFANLIKQSKSV